MQRRLLDVQNLAFDIMEEMNSSKEIEITQEIKQVIDYLSRAIGSLADPSGTYSIDYVEEKVEAAHYLLFQNKSKLKTLTK